MVFHVYNFFIINSENIDISDGVIVDIFGVVVGSPDVPVSPYCKYPTYKSRNYQILWDEWLVS